LPAGGGKRQWDAGQAANDSGGVEACPMIENIYGWFWLMMVIIMAGFTAWKLLGILAGF
jgi:hypothetical protein